MNELLNKVIALLDSGLPRKVLAEVIVDVVARSLGRLGGRPRNGLTHIEVDVSKPVTETSNSTPLTPDLISLSGADPEPSQPIEEISERDEPKPAGFLEFWDLYPKKVGKGEALRAWKRKKPPLPKVRATLEWQKRSRQWLDGIIPNPATWLNQGRWEDEPAPEVVRRAPGAPPPPSPYCEFHRRPDNRNRAAPKPVARKECPECQHTGSLLNPRAPSEPASAGDLLAKLGVAK